jgi:D-3-phosphoglycerate dehydrogenase
VNFPEVSLPGHPHSQRLLHIHRNEPGVLSRINELFSHEAVNIDGQYLRTSERIGYVVIDVSASREHARALKQKLAAIPGTLRTRVLY